MRVRQAWTNEDEVHIARLSFDWPYGGQTFSYDIGGMLSGGAFEGHFFLAESKKYAGANDQGTHFDDWMAKCYVARRDHPRLVNHFMWVTWAPFRITSWKDLCSVDTVQSGLLTAKNRKRLFDTDNLDEAKSKIDAEVVKDVASSLWIIVLSDKQEELVISAEHRAWIIERQAREEWSA